MLRFFRGIGAVLSVSFIVLLVTFGWLPLTILLALVCTYTFGISPLYTLFGGFALDLVLAWFLLFASGSIHSVNTFSNQIGCAARNQLTDLRERFVILHETAIRWINSAKTATVAVVVSFTHYVIALKRKALVLTVIVAATGGFVYDLVQISRAVSDAISSNPARTAPVKNQENKNSLQKVGKTMKVSKPPTVGKKQNRRKVRTHRFFT